ncbi:MAG: toxin-antitoxin system HicB family antitoxin, partial [Methylococcus sp.]
MIYRGHAARIYYDADDRIFTGRLAGITDVAV